MSIWAVPVAVPCAFCLIAVCDWSPVAFAPPVPIVAPAVPPAASWAAVVEGPPEPMVAIVTLRPLLPTAMPTLITVTFCELASPLLTTALWVMPVFDLSPVAPVLPVLMVPATDPFEPAGFVAPATFDPDFDVAEPTFTTRAIWRISTDDPGVACPDAC